MGEAPDAVAGQGVGDEHDEHGGQARAHAGRDPGERAAQARLGTGREQVRADDERDHHARGEADRRGHIGAPEVVRYRRTRHDQEGQPGTHGDGAEPGRGPWPADREQREQQLRHQQRLHDRERSEVQRQRVRGERDQVEHPARQPPTIPYERPDEQEHPHGQRAIVHIRRCPASRALLHGRRAGEHGGSQNRQHDSEHDQGLYRNRTTTRLPAHGHAVFTGVGFKF
nr:hypothetical protein GCM10020063_056480 [Dactylosporangium thailandense]